MSERRREGRVIKVLSERDLVIDLGSADGVRAADRFLVFQEGEPIEDPVTGESLGTLEIVRGRGRPRHIQERLTTIRSMEASRQRKKVTHPFLGNFGSEEWIEETQPEPFEDPKVGDRVRQI